MKKLLKLIKKILMVIVILGIVGGGWFYYNKYRTEKLRKLAEEEKRKQEELEKEKQRRLIEEKRKQYEEFLSEIERYFKEIKNYKKVKELAEEAFKLAKQYNFSTDRIEAILHQIELNNYISKLKKLEKENEDIYKYFYVRIEVQKIPSMKELTDIKNSILNKTYENEYKVKLILANKCLDELKKGIEPSFNYHLSRKFYAEAKEIREKRKIKKEELEDKIQNLQNELYFASKSLQQNTVPTTIY